MDIGKLTAEQSKRVADNHGLTFSFCFKHGLDIDEYYDVLALALCKASQTYNPDVSEFSTYAYSTMKFAVWDEYRKQNTYKSKVPQYLLTSTNELVGIDKDTPLIELIPSKDEPFEKQIENEMFFERLKNILSKKEKEVVELRFCKDYTFEEIAKMLNVSKQSVQQTFERAKKKIKERWG